MPEVSKFSDAASIIRKQRCCNVDQLHQTHNINGMSHASANNIHAMVCSQLLCSTIVLLVALALLTACVSEIHAQSRSDANTVKTIGACVAIQTNATTVETPIALRAVGQCESPADGNPPNCTVEIVPTGPDIILDVNDNTGTPQCLKLISGDNDPCAVVQNGPVIFQSQRHATQSFSSVLGRVRMTTMIRQKMVQQMTIDLPPSTRFPLNAGRLFDVLRNRSAIAARLEMLHDRRRSEDISNRRGGQPEPQHSFRLEEFVGTHI